MIDLTNERVLVALFVQEGCPACEEYLPRFERVADRYRRAGMPIIVYDATSTDDELVAFMDRYQIEATPTLLVLRRGPGSRRLDGALTNAETDAVLLDAYQIHVGRA